MAKVFISYSHKDEEWKDRLVNQLKVLEMEDILYLWDDRNIQTGKDWFLEIEKELESAQIVIMLISANFLTSEFIRQEEVPRILKRRKEEGVLVVPLIVKPCAWKQVKWLAAMQVTPKDGNPLMGGSEYEIEAQLAKLTEQICTLIKPEKKELTLSKELRFSALPPEHISISKLPGTGEKFFGREEELKELDAAWADEHTHIVTLIAWGGVGKSALVNRWLNIMERKNYCGARKVYGWSFYSQGAEEGKQASADEFLQETLTWFGDKNPGEGSAVDKGRRLARLVREQRTLLILDGMEPLQYPPGEVHGYDGRLKDQGLKTFLNELSAGHPGLCIITSREPVTDLAHKKGFTLKEMELEHLSTGAGMQLLKGLGVRGREKEVKTAVEEYKGHALALTLLGQYIKSAYEGDIRKRDRIPRLSEVRHGGGHAVRVMEAYGRWLGESPELDVLRILGLFDRPVEKGAVDALKAEPGIPGVTDKLGRLTEEEWQMALDNLRCASLLARNDRQKPGVLDCHPLVREHFGDKLKRENPAGWKEAHKRLYNYYKDLPEKEYPDTLAEMEPLFAAVAHGCRAGLHQEALDDVYYLRIQRDGQTNYCCNILGAFGADLAAVSHFFEKPWTLPAPGLTDHVKAVVLSWSAFRLRAQGRLHEAIQPMKAGLEMLIENENWDQAAGAAGNLSELMLTLGKVAEAVSYGRESVTHADRSGDWEEKMTDRTTLADALHQAGHLNEAEQWFREAEAMQKKRQPEYAFLYSLQGYRYCDLLLGQGTYHDVMARAEKTLEWEKEEGWLLDISLDTLSLGRAWLLKTVREESRDFTRAREYLNRAVTGLREAGTNDHLPRGLFARAECYRFMKHYSNARDDLNEAFEIAEMGGMKLFLCDYHLEAARLCAAEGKDKEAQQHFQVAKEMIEETGYLRRKNEVRSKK